MSKTYNGWELDSFDKAKNFRKYQFEIISKYIRGETAEVGAGTGLNVKYYIKNAKRLNIFEPSKKLFKILEANLNNSKIFKFNKIFNLQKNKYDTIIYLDVIEHIKNDKIEVLKAFKSLKKNGHLIINVPAFQFLYSQFDREVGHFKRYNEKDFIKMFYNVNYSKIIFKKYDILGFILSFISKILNTNVKKNFSQKIWFWNLLIPMSKIIDKITFNLLGKSLLIIIKK